MILLKNKDKKANIKIGNNIEIKDGIDFPFDLTLYGKSTQETTIGKNLFSGDYSQFDSQGGTGSTYGYFKLEEGTQHTLTMIAKNDFTPTSDTFIGFTSTGGDGSGALNWVVYLGLGAITKGTKLIKTSQLGYVSIYSKNADTLKKFTDNFDIQLEKGSTSTDYEPYTNGPSPNPDYPQEIEVATGSVSVKSTGKNLFSGYVKGIGLNATTGVQTTDANSATSDFIPLDITGTNRFKVWGLPTTISSYVSAYNKDKQFVGRSGGTITGTFDLSPTTFGAGSPTATGDVAYVRVTSYKISTSPGTINDIDNAKVMLERGTTATTYEPYKESSITIDLQGNELCSLPNGTKDELVIENGKAKIIKKVGKIVLDGSENWNVYTTTDSQGNTYGYHVSLSLQPLQEKHANNFALSNYFIQQRRDAVSIVDTQGIYLGSGTTMYIKIAQNLISGGTIANFKTWLSTHNVDVLYELAEPETINLGTVEMPHTYEGVSNITNSADTEMIVKYYKKFEFDKILRGGYNIDEQEYEIAKKQMANGKRKKILSSYVDCVIKIDLGLLDNKTYQEYKEQLEDGEYEYWSYKYNQYKKANFILTKPSITTEYAYDDDIGIDDLEITLEKSGDVDVTS